MTESDCPCGGDCQCDVERELDVPVPAFLVGKEILVGYDEESKQTVLSYRDGEWVMPVSRELYPALYRQYDSGDAL